MRRDSFQINRIGDIIAQLDTNSIIFSNHQLYIDWVIIWWLAHLANLSGNFFILLKKSLEKIPLLGYGMKNYKFIFMNRKWAQDKSLLEQSLGAINTNAIENGKNKDLTNAWGYNILLFPEGTNLCTNGIRKNNAYCKKMGLKPMKNVLMPHTTGLRFMIQNLQPSLTKIYDVTIGYSGVKGEHEFAEIKYSLKNIFLKGLGPSMIDIHIRSFNLYEIPYQDEEAFSKWLFTVWEDKNRLLDQYYINDTFQGMDGKTTLFCPAMDVNPYDFVTVVFLPVAFGMVLTASLWAYFNKKLA